LRPVSDGENDYYNYPLCCEHPGATDVISDDCVVLHTQYSTQWDSLAHVGGMFDVDGTGTPRRVYYNGYAAGSHVLGESGPVGDGDRQTVCAGALGVENMAAAAIQGRAVLVNLHKHYGDDRVEIDYGLLKHILAVDRIAVE